jgi:hypothetical protein
MPRSRPSHWRPWAATAGAACDEPSGEVVAVQECAVLGEQGDAGLERVDSVAQGRRAAAMLSAFMWAFGG